MIFEDDKVRVEITHKTETPCPTPSIRPASTDLEIREQLTSDLRDIYNRLQMLNGLSFAVTLSAPDGRTYVYVTHQVDSK